jgi:LysM repeat protein
MHYSPKHLKTAPQSMARRRIAGVGVSGVATIAAGIATSAPAHADSSVWDRVAACESGNRWNISTGNGFYGGLQFTHSTWIGYGGGAYASNANGASRTQQIAIAQRVLVGQGPGAWPVCSVRAGLTRSSGGASSAPAPAPAKHVTKKAVVKKHTVTHHKPANTHHVHATHAKPVHAAASGRTITVQRGDWLSKLAQKYHVKGGWQALWAVNKAKVSNPNLIFVGETLVLPR